MMREFKRVICWIMVIILGVIASIFVCGDADAGIIFDNGSGNRDDTLVIQFDLLDADGESYIADFDTVYIVQAFGGTAFNIDTLSVSSNYDLGSNWPLTAMFEYRLKASVHADSLGAYTWWVLGIENNEAVYTMHRGHYYVNDYGIGDLLTTADDDSYSTHDAASIWSVGTRTLTVADWSTHSAADIWSVGTRALTDKAGFSLASTGLNGVTQSSGEVLADLRQVNNVNVVDSAGHIAVSHVVGIVISADSIAVRPDNWSPADSLAYQGTTKLQ